MTSLGEVLRREREGRGLSVDHLGQMTGITSERLAELERDEGSAWFEEIIALARAFEISIDDLAAMLSGQANP